MRAAHQALPLFDAKAWLTWEGSKEEARMFGLYARVVTEDAPHDAIHCGRLMGPNEPEEHDEHGFEDDADMLGDEKWVIAVLEHRVCVWRLQD